MSAASVTVPESNIRWSLPARGPVAMYCLIAAESAIFTIFLVAYIFYIGKSLSGPAPRAVLTVPIVATICLLSSSLTIHLAVRALRNATTLIFGFWWFLTLMLGTIFLVGTGREWHRMIFYEGLTVSTNLFGTTYYSLVWLHAFHVTAGRIGIAIVMTLTLL